MPDEKKEILVKNDVIDQIIGSAHTAPQASAMWLVRLSFGADDPDYETYLGTLLRVFDPERFGGGARNLKGRDRFAWMIAELIDAKMKGGPGVMSINADGLDVQNCAYHADIPMRGSDAVILISRSEVSIFDHQTGETRSIWQVLVPGEEQPSFGIGLGKIGPLIR